MFAQMFDIYNPTEFAIILIAIGVWAILAVMLSIHISLLINLSGSLQQVRPQNRDMKPSQVWLALIPIFNIVWMPIIVTRVASSLNREYCDRRWSSRGKDYGQSVGMAFCICSIGAIIPIALLVPFYSLLFYIGGLVCFIVYWLKIAAYRNELESEPITGSDDEPRTRDMGV